MTKRDQEIARREASNARENADRGPGLRYSTSTWIVARGDGKVLLGGLGGLGIGRMWTGEEERHRRDPTYADAPYEPARLDDFGKSSTS